MPDRLRVLFVNHTLNPRAGGAEQVLLSLLSSLPRESFELHVAVPAEPVLIEPVPDTRYHRLPPLPPPHRVGRWSLIDRLRFAVSLARLNLAIARLLRRERPTAVYANSIIALHFCAVPGAISRIPLVYHEHGLVSLRRSSIWRLLFRPLARRARAIVAISEAVAVELRAIGLDSTRIRVIHNAFHGPLPELALPHARAAAKTFRVAQIANLHRWKGHATVIRALAAATQQGLDASLSLFGRAEEEGYAAELRELARTLGVERRVEFLGFVPNPSEHLARFDCVVVASDAEPFGLVILEAMAAGVPVVATAAGGAVEIVSDRVTGLLFAAGDAAQLVSCWRTLIQEPAIGELLIKNAHRQVAERFSADAQATRVAEAIRAAVDA